MSNQEGSESKSNNNRNLLVILGVAVALLICCAIAGAVVFSQLFSKSKSPLMSNVMPLHYGVFYKKGGELIELEQRESFNIPTAGDFQNLEAVAESQPTFVIWRSNTNLDYLKFYLLGEHIGESSEINYTATPKEDGIIEISPSSPLQNGEYCLAQGDPVAVSIPWWCFRSGPTEAIIQQTPNKHNYPSPNTSSLGDPKAPVKIIAFCDFQSIYCGSEWELTWQQLRDNYIATGKVYFTYRSIGSSFIGDESRAAAEAAYCAEDQGKFWEYHDLLFANLKKENTGNFSNDHLNEFAKTLDLDMKAFKKCFSEGKYSARVQQDKIDANTAGVQGVPVFFVNEKRIDGAQPYETFSRTIEEILNGK